MPTMRSIFTYRHVDPEFPALEVKLETGASVQSACVCVRACVRLREWARLCLESHRVCARVIVRVCECACVSTFA